LSATLYCYCTFPDVLITCSSEGKAATSPACGENEVKRYDPPPRDKPCQFQAKLAYKPTGYNLIGSVPVYAVRKGQSNPRFGVSPAFAYYRDAADQSAAACNLVQNFGINGDLAGPSNPSLIDLYFTVGCRSTFPTLPPIEYSQICCRQIPAEETADNDDAKADETDKLVAGSGWELVSADGEKVALKEEIAE
jgi:hypothetical protein